MNANRHEIETAIRRTGIFFGAEDRIPWRVSPDPFPITPRERDELLAVSRDCMRFLEAVHTAIQQRDPVGIAICETLGVSARRVEVMRFAPGYDAPAPMLRPDAFWDEDGRLTVVEIETMIGGFGMVEAMRSAYGGRGFPGTAAAYAGMMRGLYKEYARSGQRQVPGDGDGLSVAVVNPESKKNYDAEFGVFARALAPHGLRLQVVRPDALRRTDNGVGHADDSVHVIHRFFRLSELGQEYPGVLDDVVDVARRKLACVVQPWKELLEDKALFAFFHMPEYSPYWVRRLGVESFRRLQVSLARTWIVSPDNRKLVENLRQTTAVERQFWLKKSSDAWGARFAVDGSDTSTKKWQAALDAAVAGYEKGNVWVLQERRLSRQPQVRYFEGEGIASEPMHLRISPFTMRNGDDAVLADVLVTARKTAKVHGATDSVMLPAAVM